MRGDRREHVIGPPATWNASFFNKCRPAGGRVLLIAAHVRMSKNPELAFELRLPGNYSGLGSDLHQLGNHLFPTAYPGNSYFDMINTCSSILMFSKDQLGSKNLRGIASIRKTETATWCFNEPYGHIVSIGVHEDLRGRKLGAKLLDKILDHSKNQLGLRRAELEVRVGNEPAYKLYIKSGFRGLKLQPMYYSSHPDYPSDGVRMAKEL